MDVMKHGVDFWDQSYYAFTKIIFRMIGHWPYQSRRELLMCRVFFHFIYWIQIIPQVVAVIRHYDDVDLVMETTSSFVVDIAVITNLGTFFFNSDKLQTLLKQIKEDWKIFPIDNGLQILHEYTQIGQQRAVFYSGGLYVAWLVFVTEPIHGRLIRIFIPSNKSLPLRFAIPVDYGPLDVEEYYWSILGISAISIFGIVTVIVAADALLFLYASHACGSFAALGCVIENLPVNVPRGRHDAEDKEYQYIKKCAIMHNRILQFSHVIDDIFCWNFFILIGLNMIVISMIGVQIITNIDAIARLFKSVIYTIAVTVHLFIQCFTSQQLIDSSLGAQQNMMNARWYLSTSRTKQLLQFMIMRSQTPVQLTIGKMMPMSLNTFNSVIRTSATYFTVLLDAR